MTADPKYGRRDFLKDSVVSVAKAAREFSLHKDAPREKPVAPLRTDWLRPPGSVDETTFLERCTRCSDCIEACPPGAIVSDGTSGTPVIFADQVACELCEDFPCIAACATEALLPVTDSFEVRMGLAAVSHRSCTAGQGCNACVSKCPVEALSMDFHELRLIVERERCVGCGMCEQVCKTVNDRIAVKVTPARNLSAGRISC